MTAPGHIVVTGAGGMIGSNLVQELQATGHDIVACDYLVTLKRVKYLPGFRYSAWLRPPELFQWVNQHAGSVLAIFHLGAISDTTVTNLELLRDVNVEFSLELWRLACNFNIPFYYASSAATYGDGDAGFSDTDDLDALERLEPLNPYAWSKHTVDKAIIQDWKVGEKVPDRWGGFKFFNVYGPNEDHKRHMRSVVRKILPLVLADEPVKLFKSHKHPWSDGGQTRDFIHVADTVQMLLNAFAAPSLSGLFNVGTGKARSFLDLAHATYAAVGRNPNIEFIDMPEELQGQYQYFTQADVAKATAHALQPECRSLEQGVADYVNQLMSEPERMSHELP